MKALTPFLIIAVSIGMYFMYISPTWAEVATLRAKQAEYDNVLEQAKEIKAKRDSLISEYNSISPDDIAKLNKLIPAKFNSVLLANDLNSIATKYNIALKDVKTTGSSVRADVSETGVSEAYKTNVVNITAEGDYEQFIKFLGDVEYSLELMDVTGLTVKGAPTAVLPTSGSQKAPPPSTTLQYTVELHVYSGQ